METGVAVDYTGRVGAPGQAIGKGDRADRVGNADQPNAAAYPGASHESTPKGIDSAQDIVNLPSGPGLRRTPDRQMSVPAW